MQNSNPMDSMMMMDGPYNNQNNTSDYMDQQHQQQDQQIVDDMGYLQQDQFHQEQQEQDNFYFDSEYGKSGGDDQNSSSPLLNSHVVLRQDSASSLLDHSLDISLKKIEVMEDEYGKMKMALLSDLDDPDQDPDYLLSPQYVPEFLPLASPHDDPHQLVDNRPAHPPRQRSRDNLESIFGGGPIGYADEDEPLSPNLDFDNHPPPPPPQSHVDATTESRSSSSYTTSVITSSSSSYLSSSFNDPPPLLQHQHDHDNNYSVEDFHSHAATHHVGNRGGARNAMSMIEEPFPVCVSPEMELSVSGGPGGAPAMNRAAGHIDTIPEVPEEEEGSPTTGDGVSRKRRGKRTRL